jgi:hypothetical protein
MTNHAATARTITTALRPGLRVRTFGGRILRVRKIEREQVHYVNEADPQRVEVCSADLFISTAAEVVR